MKKLFIGLVMLCMSMVSMVSMANVQTDINDALSKTLRLQHEADSIKADIRLIDKYRKVKHFESIKINDSTLAIARNYFTDSIVKDGTDVSKYVTKVDKLADNVESVVNKTLLVVNVLFGLLVISILINTILLIFMLRMYFNKKG